MIWILRTCKNYVNHTGQILDLPGIFLKTIDASVTCGIMWKNESVYCAQGVQYKYFASHRENPGDSKEEIYEYEA